MSFENTYSSESLYAKDCYFTIDDLRKSINYAETEYRLILNLITDYIKKNGPSPIFEMLDSIKRDNFALTFDILAEAVKYLLNSNILVKNTKYEVDLNGDIGS